MRKTEETQGRPGFDYRMTKEEINDCPVRRYAGPVRVIRSKEDLAAAVDRLAKEVVLGFDIETRPAYKKGQSFPPALLQLAASDEVFVVQLGRVRLPDTLVSILTEPNIIKTGVALDDDINQLQKLARFEPAGFVDLGKIANDAGIKNFGLRGLAAVLLGFRISKNSQCTNWARDILAPAQITYAATDAWVGRELYYKIQQLA